MPEPSGMGPEGDSKREGEKDGKQGKVGEEEKFRVSPENEKFHPQAPDP